MKNMKNMKNRDFLIGIGIRILVLSALTFGWGISAFAAAGDITTVAGTGDYGFSGDNDLATNAKLSNPLDVAVDALGNIYIADSDNHRIRKVDTKGVITTVAGSGQGFSGDGSQATSAKLYDPFGVYVDALGNIFIADSSNHRIRKVDTKGVITTVAGSGQGFSGDGGQATSAQLSSPSGVFVDSSGNIFIADRDNHRIRKVDTNGIITTLAGTGKLGFSGDNGLAIKAELNDPSGVFVDSSGNIFIADSDNSRIRKVDTKGIITTVAGKIGFSGGPATSAQFVNTLGVFVDSSGNIFIADSDNSRIRKMDTKGVITTVAGTGGFDFSGDNGPATKAELNEPNSVAVDALGNIFIADTQNSRIRKVEGITSPTITLVDIPPLTATAGAAKLFKVKATPSTSSLKVKLFYKAGANPFSSLPMRDDGKDGDATANDGVWSLKLDASLITLKGLSVYFTATDKLGATDTITLSDGTKISPASPANIEVAGDLTRDIPVWLTSADWTMISFPVKLANEDPEEVFKELGKPQVDWQIYRWNGTLHDRAIKISRPNHPLGDIEKFPSIGSGKAAWVWHNQPTPATITIKGAKAMDITKPFAVKVNSGWNQLGNPFWLDIPWNSKVKFGSSTDATQATDLLTAASNKLVSNPPVVYLRSGLGYTKISAELQPSVGTEKGNLESWNGYWFLAKTDGWLFIDPTQAVSPQPTAPGYESKPIVYDYKGWMLELKANGIAINAGMSPEAKDIGEEDGLDILSPPDILSIFLYPPSSPSPTRGEGINEVLPSPTRGEGINEVFPAEPEADVGAHGGAPFDVGATGRSPLQDTKAFSFAFSNPASGAHGRAPLQANIYYDQDVRPMSRDGSVWELELKSSASSASADKLIPVTLSWSQLYAAPKEYMLLLVDPATNLSLDMRQEKAYTLTVNSGLRKLYFIASIGGKGIPEFLSKLIVKKTELWQNYPNPFNPETWIPYQLATAGEVSLRIYEVSGRLIRSLNLGRREPGLYLSKERAAYWDGRNEFGERVSSGIYFYELRAGKEFKAIKKMVILK